MVEFELSEEQQAFRDLARDFARREIAPVAAEYDERGEFPLGVLGLAHRAGLLNLEVPEEYGGAGLGPFEVSLIAEEFGAACAGIATSLLGNGLALLPIILHGTAEQKQRVLAPFCAEPRLAAFCLTEPGAGSDISVISTTAHGGQEVFVLNGVKSFITNGGLASLYVVVASTDRKRGARGLSAFIVPAGTIGLSTGKKERKMGQRASDTREVIFEDVQVPAVNLLGRQGQGVAAIGVGLARAAFELAREYARQRVQFGQPIASHQAVQMMLADMAIGVDTARLLTWRAARAFERGEPEAERYSAMAKCYASDVAMRVTTDAVQVLGGYGYMRDYPAEKYMRDAKLLQIYEGTNQIQRLMIARRL
jgi:acyl-CoA dehydrogenase